jgi:(aminoalkyl)phosphonate N-acetyltransferase
MKTSIRNASISDFDAIYELINELENKEFDKATQGVILKENLNNPDHIYLVATVNGIVVGMLTCHVQQLLHHGEKVGEIVEMIVKSQFIGIGIGQRMISKCFDLARERGIKFLEVTSNNKRVKAHAFYENIGFRQSHKKFTMNLSNDNST